MAGPGKPIGRRMVLGLLGLGALGVVAGSRVQRGLEWALAPILDRTGGGLAGLLPVGRFRIYSVTGTTPVKERGDWRMRIDGFVDAPVDLGFDDLLSFPQTSLTADFQCVTGWRVPDVAWVGVTVAQLLERAGVRPGASGVRFYSYDGLYTESLTLDQALRRDVFVVHELEGKPLPVIQGGPVRLLVVPMYGYKSLKWLDRIEVTEELAPVGYWANRGYDQEAWVGRSNGRDDAPTETQTPSPSRS
ncbi:MAG: molybdopterin-dependent oxidoreductase [Acidimicrobiales bacterium]